MLFSRSTGRDLEWRRRIEELLLLMRANSGDEDGAFSFAGCLLEVFAEVVEGASYSTSVGKPNAVMRAGDTMGEVYKFGSGSSSLGDFCFLVGLNVESLLLILYLLADDLL